MKREEMKGKRERIQGDTTKIKGHLRGNMETKYNRIFLKYMHTLQ